MTLKYKGRLHNSIGKISDVKYDKDKKEVTATFNVDKGKWYYDNTKGSSFMATRNDQPRQEVFEYLIVKHPTKKEADDGRDAEIITPTTLVCAENQAAARLIANRAIPEEEMKHKSRLEVVIRPFC